MYNRWAFTCCTNIQTMIMQSFGRILLQGKFIMTIVKEWFGFLNAEMRGKEERLWQYKLVLAMQNLKYILTLIMPDWMCVVTTLHYFCMTPSIPCYLKLSLLLWEPASPYKLDMQYYEFFSLLKVVTFIYLFYLLF